MVRPPAIDDLQKVNFITNYFMQGCVPPFWLFIECAQEPAREMLCLLLGLDMQDIVQAMFEPKGQRHRRQGRHGRKRKGKFGFPDISDMVGEKIRSHVNPHNALDFGPFRKLFKVVNVYEGWAFSTAVVEGMTDVGFEGILGVISADPDSCPNFGFFWSKVDGDEILLAIQQPWAPLNLVIDVQMQNFNKTTGFKVTNVHSDFTVAFACEVSGMFGERADAVSIALMNQDGVILAEDGPWDLAPGEVRPMRLNAEYNKDDLCVWVGRCEYGNVLVENCEAFGFQGTWG